MLGPIADHITGKVEIVYVDDGSRDGTLEALLAVQARDPRVRVVELAANFGQNAAIFAGIEIARGENLVTFDIDLQCDPLDIPRVLDPLSDGYDLVCGVRVCRSDPIVRRFFSRLMSIAVRQIAGVSLRDAGCPLNALSSDIARQLSRYGELRRFAKPLAVRLARRMIEVEVRHRPRPAEKPRSSYSATRLVRLSMDFLINAVGDVFAWTFLISICLALLLALGTLGTIVASGILPVSPMLPIIMGVGSLTALITALVSLAGEVMQRIHRQTAGQPLYLVRRVHDP